MIEGAGLVKYTNNTEIGPLKPVNMTYIGLFGPQKPVNMTSIGIFGSLGVAGFWNLTEFGAPCSRCSSPLLHGSRGRWASLVLISSAL